MFAGQRYILHRLGRVDIRGVRYFLRPRHSQHADVRIGVQADGEAESSPRVLKLSRDRQQRRRSAARLRSYTVRGDVQPLQFHIHRLRPHRRGHVPRHHQDVQAVRSHTEVPHTVRRPVQMDPQCEEELQVHISISFRLFRPTMLLSQDTKRAILNYSQQTGKVPQLAARAKRRANDVRNAEDRQDGTIHDRSGDSRAPGGLSLSRSRPSRY